MSAFVTSTVRIWLIDKLHPEKSFNEFSEFADEIAENIYLLNHNKLINDASQHTNDGRKPIDIKIKLETGETLNIKELYFEALDDMDIAKDSSTLQSYRCFSDWHYTYNGPMSRSIVDPYGKSILNINEYVEELYANEYIELKDNPTGAVKTVDGDWLAHLKWIDDNPKWSFQKIVLDNLPMYIINADLNYRSLDDF